MGIAADLHERAEPSRGTFTGTENDRALNYQTDQAPDIQKELRHLRWEKTLERLPDSAAAALSAGLLGGAALFLVRRRWVKAGLCLLGYLYQVGLRDLVGREAAERRPGVRDRQERELEEYALHTQRGDYGKVEVIPFR